jgi:hypothetical protein
MLGFATVDVVAGETYTVWLTSRTERTRANHTNAVVFRFDDPDPWERGLPQAMLANRLVLLTEGTDARDAEVKEPLNADHLLAIASATRDLQDTISTSFEQYRAQPGKAELIEPTFHGIPQALDQSTLRDLPPEDRTLQVANALSRTWTAWLTTELERTKRARYVPWDGYPSASNEECREVREFPARFIEALPSPWLVSDR